MSETASAFRPDPQDLLPETPARSAYLALVQAHEYFHAHFQGLFRRARLTGPQFNVLRILIQAPPEGLRACEIRAQLIHRVPDVSRLVERMLRDGLVERLPDPEDRRAVRVRLTREGTERCRGMYAPLEELHGQLLAHLSRAEQRQLNDLLRRAYAPGLAPDQA